MRLIKFGLVVILMLAVNFTFANVWLDETFDDGAAFDASALDPYSYEAPADPVNLTANGSLTTEAVYNGTYAYKLDAGQSIYITEPYSKQGNGPFQYFQFAVHFESVPAAGSVAEFRWNFTFDSVTNSFYVEFVSDGTNIEVMAGEDSVFGEEARIDLINDTSHWKYITVQVQKNSSLESDERVMQEDVPHVVRFYSSNDIPALEIALGTTTIADKANAWTFNCTSGSIYLDDMYWDGGMTGSVENSNLRDLDQGDDTLYTYANSWECFK